MPVKSGSATSARAQPRKRFGQHFLTDPNLLEKIVRAGEIQLGEVALEIGPGRGHLTRALANAGARVCAVEIDPVLAARLTSELQEVLNVTVLQGDFLTASPEVWLARAGLAADAYKVVANLPYYITSAIFRHLLEAAHPPSLIVVMVQREVATQLTAQPPRMNLLGLSAQFYGEPQIIGVVPAGAFYPRPKVDSAIVRIRVNPQPRWRDVDSARFFAIVRAGFGARRKQLHNALARGLKLSSDEVRRRLARAGIAPTRRAETLTLDEWRNVCLQFPPGEA
jgi:16S rRNA (adenine1518-N6/adenine1519-N6)-dimethyltransferase